MLLLIVTSAAFTPPIASVRPAVLHRTHLVARAGDGEGAKGAVGGAVLGGLLAGPFGAVFGAQLGSTFGAERGARKADDARLDAMGLSREVRAAAAAAAADLAEAEEGLKLCQQALSSARSLEAQHEASAGRFYASAEGALKAGDEVEARSFLEKRQQANTQRATAEIEVQQAAARARTMQDVVAAATERIMTVEAAMTKVLASNAAINAATASRASDGLLGDDDDPLLRRFKDLEG